MSTEIKVPTFPESISEGTIAKWHKKIGDTVKRDENLVDVETDKVVLEVPAPFDGVLDEIIKKEGETVEADTVIGRLKEGKAEEGKAKKKEEEKAPVQEKKIEKEEAKKPKAAEMDLSPSVRRLVAEHDIDVSEVAGTGKEGRLTKEDVERHLETQKESKEKEAGKKKEPEQKAVPEEKEHAEGDRLEKRVPMTRLRARIAERLLSAQQNMAILTTFNEINMQQVIDLRTEYRDLFEKKHGVRLGFMSFFIRATTIALKRFPDVNASIEGNEIIYHGYCDIGVAVSTERGLVVPVLKNADQMSMAEMEAKIAEFSTKARDNKLTLEEITGGTFTITNGGVFGSLLATPIVNPPQSAILGMHKIEDRPIVEKGQIVVRPMMYVALSYDHRIIDGKDSVQFLRTVKELLEDPGRLLLDV